MPDQICDCGHAMTDHIKSGWENEARYEECTKQRCKCEYFDPLINDE